MAVISILLWWAGLYILLWS